MQRRLEEYIPVAGQDVVNQLRQLAEPLKGMRVVHLNSTREGGGVAEILDRLVPLKRELGLDAVWEVISGDPPFYVCTKGMHNALQGDPVEITPDLLRVYEETGRKEADRLRELLRDAEMVFIHDPQPASLITHIPDRKGAWVWRCHIDVSRPYRPVWKYLRRHVNSYDASIWHLPSFAQPLDHPQYLIPPSIDPLSEKNRELNSAELQEIFRTYTLDPDRPILLQVSRFDRFKDPVGVIQAYRMAKRFVPLQLVLAGGTATDDPEGQLVLDQVRDASAGDPDIHILLLPPDSHRTINALQRVADIVLQKSLKEGFGLTVTEAMWKMKPVIGGDVGGIRLQVINHHTGFLVSSPEGAAHRIRYLLKNRTRMHEMGREAYRFVQENFLLTRHLREYLTLMVGLAHNSHDRIEL